VVIRRLINRTQVDFAPREDTYGLQVFKECWEFDGGTKTYWKYKLPDVAQVVALTPNGKIIAVREFQPGVGADYLHLPAETFEPDESPIEVAKRGLLEETGFAGTSFQYLSAILENSGRSDRLIHAILVTNCVKIQPGEDGITVQLLEPKELWTAMLENFLINVDRPHGGGNSLMVMTVAFHHLGLVGVRAPAQGDEGG